MRPSGHPANPSPSDASSESLASREAISYSRRRSQGSGLRNHRVTSPGPEANAETAHDRTALITMSASTTTFTQNERVLCYHGPMIYEAKILKIDNWDETSTRTGSIGPHFFVHYKGWKQTRVPFTLQLDARFLIFQGNCRWDEWVPAARLLKYNETNLELAKTLKNASTASTSKSANKSAYLSPRYCTVCLIFSARDWHRRGCWYRGDRFLSTERWPWHKEGTGRG